MQVTRLVVQGLLSCDPNRCSESDPGATLPALSRCVGPGAAHVKKQNAFVEFCHVKQKIPLRLISHWMRRDVQGNKRKNAARIRERNASRTQCETRLGVSEADQCGLRVSSSMHRPFPRKIAPLPYFCVRFSPQNCKNCDLPPSPLHCTLDRCTLLHKAPYQRLNPATPMCCTCP